MDSSLHFLRRSSNEDLEPLVKYLTKPITEELSTKEKYKKHYPNHREYVDEIAFELSLFGGNTIVNWIRGKVLYSIICYVVPPRHWNRSQGPPYKEIVRDVASKLKVNYTEDDSVEEVELKILIEIFRRSFDGMSDVERDEVIKAFEEAGAKIDFSDGVPIATVIVQIIMKSSRNFAEQIAMIVANAVAKTVLGQGLKLVGVDLAKKAFAKRMMGVFTGPIGWTITAIWTAIDISGPAYRVTIPCVCHIAYLRQKTKNQDDFGGDE